MKRACAAVLIGLLPHSATALSDNHACAANPQIVAPCFDVRGRLSFWNGAPSARIWRIGTTRMLGIHDDVLPGEIRSLRTSFDTEILGTFSVCPFTLQEPGHMQFVCIESWRDITIRERLNRADSQFPSPGRAVVHE